MVIRREQVNKLIGHKVVVTLHNGRRHRGILLGTDAKLAGQTGMVGIGPVGPRKNGYGGHYFPFDLLVSISDEGMPND